MTQDKRGRKADPSKRKRGTQQDCDSGDEDDGNTPRCPNRQRICTFLNDVDDGSEVFGSSTEKSGAARIVF